MILDHHICMLFRQVDEIPSLIQKIRKARKPRDCWIFVSNGHDSSGAGHAAGFLEPDMTIDTASLGMRELPISINDIMGKLRNLADSTMASGSKSVMFFLDMSWLLNTPSGIAHLGEFEACLHQWAVKSPIRSICLYNQLLFPEGLVLDVLRTHPYLYSSQGLRTNPHFLPPNAYLSGDPAEQLKSWMDSMGPAHTRCWGDLSASKGLADPSSVSESSKTPEQPSRPAAAQNTANVIDYMDSSSDTCLKQRRWKIRSLGNLRIYRQDGTPVRWDKIHGATVKTKTLFAMLLQSGSKGVSAEEIADILWPDSSSTDQSLNRLYHTVHCLRMGLDPEFSSRKGDTYVVSRGHRYYLELPEGTWVDGPIFEQYCRRGEQLLKARNLEESLVCHQVAEKLYSGPLFSDIPDKYSSSMDFDWCGSRRYWLEEMHVKMLAYTARIHRELGNADQALTYAEKALKVEPCFELAHQEAIRAFKLLDRHDAIERQYRLCCESLRRFEQRAPSSDTRALFQSLATSWL